MTVEQALRALRRNPKDSFAWEVIALDVYQPLIAYVASLLLTFRIAPSETAHDIVHDVLLTFYERWSASSADISSAGSLHAYLRASCRNLLIDRYRRERNIGQLSDFITLRFAEAFPDYGGSYKTLFLEEIIKKVPSECSKLFTLYASEDLTPAEIADRLNISPAAFYSRWHRCIQRAKELFLQKKGLPKRL